MESSSVQRICLICHKLPGSSWGDKFSSLDTKALGQAIKKIFQYLLIPHSKQEDIRDLIDFCPDCFITVRGIMEMQKKMQALELMIQYKVETLGKIVLKTPMEGLVGKGKASQKIWEKFRHPVIECFLKGHLPSPSVSLTAKQESSEDSQSETSETTEEPQQQIQEVITRLQSEQKSNTDNVEKPGRRVSTTDDVADPFFNERAERDGYIREEAVDDNFDTESITVEYKWHMEMEGSATGDGAYNLDYDYESGNGDISFSPQTGDKFSPESPEYNSVNEKRVNPDESSTIIKPWHELNNHAEKEIPYVSMLSKNYRHFDSDAKPYEILKISSENTLEQLEENTETTSGPPETNETETSVSADPDNEGQLQTKELERKRGCTRPVRSSAPKRFKCSSDEDYSPEESDASDSDFEIDKDDDVRNKELLELMADQETCETSQLTSTLDLANLSASENDSNPFVHTPTTHESQMPWKTRKKGLYSQEKLVENRTPKPNRYSMNCPQCDFVATTDNMNLKTPWECQLFVQYKVADHFTECHNPIKLLNLSKSPDGDDCYKCLQCDFYSNISGNKYNKKHNALRDLSLHYIIKHDGCKEDEVTPEVLNNLNHEVTPEVLNNLNHEVTPEVLNNLNHEVTPEVLNNLNHEVTQEVLNNLNHVDTPEVLNNLNHEVTPEVLNNLNPGIDYFKCPESTCNFCIFTKRSQRTAKYQRKLARRALLHHFIVLHEQVDISVKKSDGKNCHKCPKCDFVSFFEECNNKDASKHRPFRSKYSSARCLIHHYNGAHSPPALFDALYPLSSTDYVIEEVGEDKVLKCKICGYLTKICKIAPDGIEYSEYYCRAKGVFVSHFSRAHVDSVPSFGKPYSLNPAVRKQGKYPTQSGNNAKDLPCCATDQPPLILNPALEEDFHFDFGC